MQYVDNRLGNGTVKVLDYKAGLWRSFQVGCVAPKRDIVINEPTREDEDQHAGYSAQAARR